MIFAPQILESPELQALLFQAGFLRQEVLLTPLNPRLELELQFNTSLQATHHSTAIEGNPLTLEEVRQLLSGKPLSASSDKDISYTCEYQNFVCQIK